MSGSKQEVTVSSREYYRGRRSILIAGTAVLGSMVAVLEFGRLLRIPFPLFPTLKFDIVGIPMGIAYFFFGLAPGLSTSLVSFVVISTRDPLSGAMKALAESSTILGAFLVLRGRTLNYSYKKKVLAIASSIALRVIVMSVANVFLLPVYMPRFYQTPEAVVAVLHFIAAFNAIQGGISIAGSILVYEAAVLRIPSLKV